MDGKLAEHRVLMSHIESQFRLIIQVFIASLIVSLGLLGYALQIAVSDPYVFLSPILIFMPCSYLLISLREEIFRWGTYIIVFIEDGKDLRYETALAKFREKYRLPESLTPIYWSYWLLLTISVFLFALHSWRAGPPCLQYWIGWGLVILATGLILYLLHRRYSQIPEKKTKEFRDMWESIKKDLNNN